MERDLRSLIGDMSEYPSVSVLVPYSNLPNAEDANELDELEQRKSNGASEVRVTFDPGLFEWFTPRSPKRLILGEPYVKLTKTHIYLSNLTQLQEWEGKHIQVGLLPKAMAFRLAGEGPGWRLRREAKAPRRLTYQIQVPVWFREMLQKRGWPFFTPMRAQWVEEHRMVVCRMPAEANGKKVASRN